MMFDGYSDLNGDAYPAPIKPGNAVTEEQVFAEGAEPLVIGNVFGHKPALEVILTTKPNLVATVGGAVLAVGNLDFSDAELA